MSDLDLLRQLAAPAPAPTPEAQRTALQALERHIALARAAAAPAPAAAPPRRRAPRRRRFALPAMAAAAVAAAVLVLVGTDDGAAPAPASAATVLHHAAAAAREQAPAQALGPGQYLYTESVGAVLYVTQGAQAIRRLVPLRREAWRDGDGDGWLTSRPGTPTWLTPGDHDAWVAAGRPHLGTGASDVALSGADRADVPPGTKTAPLPSTPAALAQRLRADAADAKGAPVDQQVFLEVGDALRQVSTTPAQRAALYEVAAQLPGVGLSDDARDGTGRAGVAVAMDVPGKAMRLELVFDRDTYTLLGETTTTLADNPYNLPEGTRIGWTAHVRTAVVDGIRQRP
ncbi:hypothetical protein DSM104299_03879 [Baekduia alba]|uniref:CU044_5270 family protein n=1 Tax=Baekduia alba TaxID=2997333 RepID=UPI002342570B|nr:CU044_5270 family protein [Baekduia alba]WCB95137.1 hypothetical protein DSM104299_03879 [Baekduia alba]